LIVGAGIAGLSLQYFLAKRGIDSTVIDFKKEIGKPIRDTGLISNLIFKIFPIEKEELIEEEFEEAELIFQKTSFKVKSKKSKMFIVKRDLLDKKIFELTNSYIKPKIILNRKVVGFKNNEAILNDGRKIEYDLLIGADGTFSIVSKFFKMDKNVKYFLAQEAITKVNNKGKFIKVFFGKEFSKTYFLWKVLYKNKMKIGYIDLKLNENFENFLEGRKIYQYSDLIKIGETELQKDNVMLVGEASGIIKPFSLGGITYAVLTSLIASNVISKGVEIEKYKKVVRGLFLKGILIGKTAKKLIKFNKIIKLLRINSIISILHPDLLF